MPNQRETHTPPRDATGGVPWVDAPESDADWWLRHPLHGSNRGNPRKDTR